MKMQNLALLLLFLSCAMSIRPIKIFMYQWIPDLNGDTFAGLAAKLEQEFLADTGLVVDIQYGYQYSTYDIDSMVEAMTTGGFDLVEIDAHTVPFLSANNVIKPIPPLVSMTGFTPESKAMSRNSAGITYMVPSYSCVDVMFSYDAALDGITDVTDLIPWINSKLAGHPERIGWATDILNVWGLRLAYIDSYLDTFPSRPLYPLAYSSHLNQEIVGYVRDMRDTCVDKLTNPHSNPCVEGTYYVDFDRYFGDLVNGRAVVLQGFPEYLSTILALNSTMPHITPAKLGNGNKNFVFTNGFAISKANCDVECMVSALVWLNWQKANHARITSLGLDLSPPRPRYLMISWAPFYQTAATQAYSQYATYWSWQSAGKALQILNLESTQDAQYAALTAALITDYVAP
jgi:hypothetical protein